MKKERRKVKEGEREGGEKEGREESIVIPVSSFTPSAPDPPKKKQRNLSSGYTLSAPVMLKVSTHL